MTTVFLILYYKVSCQNRNWPINKKQPVKYRLIFSISCILYTTMYIWTLVGKSLSSTFFILVDEIINNSFKIFSISTVHVIIALISWRFK